MIVLSNITKSYPLRGFRRHYVFRGFNLELPAKTHIGIVGRNGVGKSTLMRLLGGIELPDKGSVQSEGLISPPLGLTSGFAKKLSGRDNARFVSRINGDSPGAQRDRVAFIESFCELGDFFDNPVESYSSGMKARLGFAISMSYDYDYYLIDELTAVGDKIFRRKAQASFSEKRGHASIIMVSHNLKHLERDCEVGVYLHSGGADYYKDIRDAIAAYNEDMSERS